MFHTYAGSVRKEAHMQKSEIVANLAAGPSIAVRMPS
jgi:hypothetical protein